jgi:hypothetical protein
MPSDGLWKFLQAEALDALDIREGHLSKVVIVGECVQPGGKRTFAVSIDNKNHALKPHEEAGLLVRRLTKVLEE